MVVWEQATRIDLEKDEMFSRSYWKIGIIERIQFGNLCLQQVLQDRSRSIDAWQYLTDRQ